LHFFSTNIGWSGGWNTSSSVGGMFKWNGALSVEDISKTGNLNVYPNPMEENFVVVLRDDPHNAEFILTDISGRIVQKIENISTNVIAIHRGDLSSAYIYFLLQMKKLLLGQEN